jgi:adenylate/guanylate cyclase family protein
MIALLNALFARFDALAASLGLEKIKTIGDGYMVAGGIPEPCPDHASLVIDMAIAMAGAADATGAEFDRLRLRIGVHSGPLVAGVIGTHKFVYDVWGDTVTTAARMEQHGEPGQVHVSAATWALVRDRYRFDPRGEIEIKGKGDDGDLFPRADRPAQPRLHAEQDETAIDGGIVPIGSRMVRPAARMSSSGWLRLRLQLQHASPQRVSPRETRHDLGARRTAVRLRFGVGIGALRPRAAAPGHGGRYRDLPFRYRPSVAGKSCTTSRQAANA